MKITFERAIPADVGALVKVQIAAFHDDARLYGVRLDGPPGYDSLAETLKKISQEDFYKILVDGQIVGGLAVYNHGDGWYHLDVIFINPALHNRGIGTQAMEFIERTFPAKKWTLNTPDYSTRNHHFYEKFGYMRVGSAPFEDFVLYDYEKTV